MDLPPEIRAKVDSINMRKGRHVPAYRRLLAAVLDARQEQSGERITPREREVIELLVEGLSNKDIAARLWVSEETVKTHLRRVMPRTNCRNRTQLAVRFVRGELHVAD